MSQKNKFWAVLLGVVLVSLLLVPLAASAQEAGTGTGITTPANNATVSGVVQMSMNVPGGENFSRWELLLFPNGIIDDNNKIWLAGGDQAGTISYSLDTSRFPEGTHALVLRVVGANSNYTDYVNTVTFGGAGAGVAAGATPAATATTTGTMAAAAATVAPATTATPGATTAATGTGIVTPANNATVSGVVNMAINVPAVANFSRWELLLFPNGVVDDSNKIWLAGGDQTGSVSYSLDTSRFPGGTHIMSLRVVDPSSNYTDYMNTVTFGAVGAGAATGATPGATATAGSAATATPAAAAATATPAAPAAGIGTGITAPAASATLSGSVNVTANVASDNFSRWELLLFPNGVIDDNNKIWLAGGDQAGAVSYTLDTTQYPAGTHTLVLRVVNATTNYTDYPLSFTIGAGS